MKVRALQNILYNGAVYAKGTEFEIDECTGAISLKYNKIEKLQGGDVAEPEIEEGEPAEGLPPLKKKK